MCGFCGKILDPSVLASPLEHMTKKLSLSFVQFVVYFELYQFQQLLKLKGVQKHKITVVKIRVCS